MEKKFRLLINIRWDNIVSVSYHVYQYYYFSKIYFTCSNQINYRHKVASIIASIIVLNCEHFDVMPFRYYSHKFLLKITILLSKHIA